ncbi:endonuclease/exonuclease/phosphatase family protein [Clostridium swellfunianum]|uniref:endonuclease/exonuclease/phosphatase family protein n=1 Tax=Clostridium swellfunianum TaxID=1367462 RepID=UPI00202E30C2|nr:endonuclease/exonuclease/phosphatase family protein [Clostridium swellfunianum]MCM0650805.1 endonuclease/exonuclease/phosphatase family protein [Clostridium swellfunianum]
MLKVLTLNMHSYFEPRTYWAFYKLAKDIAYNNYDIVCLQEVNQLRYTSIIFDKVRIDNAAYVIKLILQEEFNLNYNLFWDKAKTLDGLIEEGVAILTPHKILERESRYVSDLTADEEWRCRKNVYGCIEKDGVSYNVFSVHFAWEYDGKERFENQFARFLDWMKDKDENLIVAGDFNIDYKSEAYKLMEQTNWKDVSRATNKEHLATAFDENGEGIHIDYVFTNIIGAYEYTLKFDGNNESSISDHRGIYALIK